MSNNYKKPFFCNTFLDVGCNNASTGFPENTCKPKTKKYIQVTNKDAAKEHCHVGAKDFVTLLEMDSFYLQ